jgi:formylglycine-generating enzyme required for sulfatase activity
MTQPTNDNRLRRIRGGSWLDDASWMRSSVRCYFAPAMRSGYVGFRTLARCRCPR